MREKGQTQRCLGLSQLFKAFEFERGEMIEASLLLGLLGCNKENRIYIDLVYIYYIKSKKEREVSYICT